MKAALIGYGYIGSGVHKAAYDAMKADGSEVELVAICDVRPELLEDAAKEGIRTYTSVDELLENEKELDFADICVPTFLHAQVAVKCMKAGVNTLVEKPMATNMEDAQAMIDCAKETGKKLMVAHCCRFNADLQIIHQFILEQKFGKPQSAFFTCVGGKPEWGWENWFCDKNRAGGCMLDVQAHNLDLINWFFGEPMAVSCVAMEREAGEGYCSVSANHIYGDGLFVHSWADWWVKGNKHQGRTVRINFENGYIYNNRGKDHVLVAVDRDGNETDLTGTITLTGSSYRNEIEYFVRNLKNGGDCRLCAPADSATVVKIKLAQEKSAQHSGVPVYLD